MKANGDFFVLRPFAGGISVIEWAESAKSWRPAGSIEFALECSAPGGGTATGGFHSICAYSGGQRRLMHWEPKASIANLGAAGTQMSGPSDVMYGSRVYVIGQSGANSGSLFERFDALNAAWFDFKSPTTSPLRASPPLVLRDGDLFVANMLGEAWQMWWNAANSTWNWHNHGQPAKSLALSLGAAMPESSKVFVTCKDGTLRQIYYSGNHWIWHSHGNPFGYNVDSPAVAIADGKLFVTGNSGAHQALLQLYWNGSTWVWYNHGRPGGSTLLPGAITARGANQVVVKATNARFYQTYWTGAKWEWRDIGTPPEFPPLAIVVHVQGRGDVAAAHGEWAGTFGNGVPLGGFSVLPRPVAPGVDLEYMAHLASVGDTGFVKAGQFVGTRGEARALEGFAARLVGPNASRYDLFYQCHVAGLGDSVVLRGSETEAAPVAFCGTRGESRAIEALRIWMVAK